MSWSADLTLTIIQVYNISYFAKPACNTVDAPPRNIQKKVNKARPMPTMWWKKLLLEVKNRCGLLISIYFSFSSPVISYFPLLSFQPLQQAIGGYDIGSYVGSEVENAAAKLQHKLSPVKDVTKRPFLSGGPRCEDELDTEALYTFNSLHAWYDSCPCVAGIFCVQDLTYDGHQHYCWYLRRKMDLWPLGWTLSW